MGYRKEDTRAGRREGGSRGGSFGGRSGFSGRSSGGFRGKSGGFGRRESRNRMHTVTCDKCKQECEVPFKPSQDKPVYCSDCFRKSDGRESRGGSNSEAKMKASAPEVTAEDIAQINEKLDKIMKILNVD